MFETVKQTQWDIEINRFIELLFIHLEMGFEKIFENQLFYF